MIILTFLLSVVIHWKWVFLWNIFTSGDWWFKFNESLVDVYNLYIWQSFENFGMDSVLINFAPLGYVFTIIFHTAPNLFILFEKLLFFVPITLLAPIGSFLLVKHYFNKNSLAFIGSVIFCYNTYFLIRQADHLNIAVAYAISPFLILLLLKILEQKYEYVVAFSLTFFISSVYEVRITYISSLILAFLIFASIFKKGFGPKKMRSFIIIGILTFLLSIYWILPIAFLGQNSTLSTITERPLFISYHQLINAYTLYYPFWTGTEPIPFEPQQIPTYAFIIPLFAIIGMIFHSNRIKFDQKWAWVLIACVGFFLIKQNGAPLPNLYGWLYINVPGFNFFRESSKFYLLVILSYTLLIPYSIYIIEEFLLKKLKMLKEYVLPTLTIIVISFFLINTIPLLTGKYGTLFIKRQISPDYEIVKAILAKEEHGRIMWIPVKSRFGYFSNTSPRVSISEVIDQQWKIYSSSKDTVENEMVFPLKQPQSNVLIDTANIKYIVIPLDDKINDGDFFIYYGGKENPNIRQWYIDQLDTLPYLKRIDIGTKELVVYENEGYLPYIRAMTIPNQYDSFELLNDKYTFSSAMLEQPFDFFVSTTTAAFPAVHTRLLFEDITPSSLDNDIMTATLGQAETQRLYMPTDAKLMEHADRSFTITPSDTSHAQARPLETGRYARRTITIATSTTLQYKASAPFTNSISNPSFEDGLWQQDVGDCNAYDDNPILSMRTTSNARTGTAALELSTTRHTACTNQQVTIHGGHKYLFSFAYQSPNAKEAGYYIGYTVVTPDGSTTTSISDHVPVKGAGWQDFRKIIEVPDHAIRATVYFYSFAKDDETPIVTRYDDVNLIELPDDIFDYWLVARPDTNLIQPREVTFDIINPTKKLVHIKGATTPFYLAMSESYHPQWQLEMNNAKIHGWLRSWVPWAHPDRVGDEMHFELDGFLNGWYVDPAALCTENQTACTRNDDGSYDIEMVIEFSPQRWFYVGLIVSGTTLFLCIQYLIYDSVARLRKRRAVSTTSINATV